MTPSRTVRCALLLLAMVATPGFAQPIACDQRARPGRQGDDDDACACSPRRCLWFCTPVADGPPHSVAASEPADGRPMAHGVRGAAKGLGVATAASGPS